MSAWVYGTLHTPWAHYTANRAGCCQRTALSLKGNATAYGSLKTACTGTLPPEPCRTLVSFHPGHRGSTCQDRRPVNCSSTPFIYMEDFFESCKHSPPCVARAGSRSEQSSAFICMNSSWIDQISRSISVPFPAESHVGIKMPRDSHLEV